LDSEHAYFICKCVFINLFSEFITATINIYIYSVCCTKAFTPPDPYDCLDLFSGERAISKAFAAKKLRSCELDIAHDPRDETCHAYFSSYSYIICACKLHMSCRFLVAYKDILSPGGFCRFLWAAMNLKENGLMVAGIKCSTWSIVNSGLAACWFHWCSNVDIYLPAMVLLSQPSQDTRAEEQWRSLLEIGCYA